MEQVYISHSEEDTAELARKLASITQKGDVWALSGTLGMGKSVFARAFIQQLSAADEVPSPTFTLVQTYDAKKFTIYHYDLYRIKAAEEIFELGVEEAFYEGVSLIEWPEKMAQYAPRNMWHIRFEPDGNGRKITIKSDDKLKMQRLANV